MKIIQKNPKDASAVILHHEGSVLLQKRDYKEGIFYPGYWGLFGGARDKKEMYLTNIQREIYEELNLDLSKKNIKYFFKLKIQFPITKKKYKFVNRFFYIYEIKNISIFKSKITLREGQKYSFFNNLNYINLQITPYDRFALDLFFKFV